VPAWAAANPVNDASGNRWCIKECRFRERTTTSERGTDETASAYEKALADAGWRRWQAPLCPDPDQPVNGRYTCWERDELTLDLWVRERVCQGQAGQPVRGGEQCPGSAVTVKVQNAVADERTGPRPTTDPSLTGEDPDPLVTDDPLLDPTADPS
jgi:integrin beta 3